VASCNGGTYSGTQPDLHCLDISNASIERKEIDEPIENEMVKNDGEYLDLGSEVRAGI
jgi:hypothetical protein